MKGKGVKGEGVEGPVRLRCGGVRVWIEDME